MMTLTASQARVQLHNLLDKICESREPIQITGKRHNAILISEDGWRAVNETIYLLSMPNVRESIRRGLKVDVKECSKKLKWPNQSVRLGRGLCPARPKTAERSPLDVTGIRTAVKTKDIVAVVRESRKRSV